MQEPPLKRRLVIVDDDQFMLTMITAMLGRIGEFDVQGFTDAPAAFRSIRDAAAAPDLVILDINMPEMNGIEFLKARAADTGIKGIPVIVLTTQDEEALKAEALSLGANDFLAKPFQKEALIAAVGRTLKV